MTPDDPVQAGGGGLDAPPRRTPSTWQRLLDNKTGPQRLVISLGALAAAVIAIGGVVTAVVRVFDGDGSPSLDRAPNETQQIESRSTDADRFVQDLLDHDGSVVELDHKLIAQRGPADVSLLYDCSDVCSTVRVQAPEGGADETAEWLWFQGCYAVTKTGFGYGADVLDIALRPQGESCR